MIGPHPKGTYSDNSAPNCGSSWETLHSGKWYQVIREFRDHDRDLHPAGESWKFLGFSYNRHDGGLSLFVSIDGEMEWHIPFLCTTDGQLEVVDYIAAYIAEL